LYAIFQRTFASNNTPAKYLALSGAIYLECDWLKKISLTVWQYLLDDKVSFLALSLNEPQLNKAK
jgi:hypothetical protein